MSMAAIGNFKPQSEGGPSVEQQAFAVFELNPSVRWRRRSTSRRLLTMKCLINEALANQS